MMFNYPFSPFRNRTYPTKYFNYPFYKSNYNTIQENLKNYNIKKSFEEETIASEEKKDQRNNINREEEQFISILGIHLHFDDLIILALLFFLYNEGVKDEGLFICLILLLLT